ncbi:hypothetical protein PENTCL1PPCAC_14865, partial [Pristionchus entomophagus]
LVRWALLAFIVTASTRACIRMIPTDPGIPAMPPIDPCTKCTAATIEYRNKNSLWANPMPDIDNSGSCTKITNECIGAPANVMLYNAAESMEEPCGNPCEITC